MTRHILFLLKFFEKKKKPEKKSPLFRPEFIFQSVENKSVSKIKTFSSEVQNLLQLRHIIEWVLQKSILRRWEYIVCHHNRLLLDKNYIGVLIKSLTS